MCGNSGVELTNMNINYLLIVPPGGPCPKQCGQQATFTLTDFDTRTVAVECGGCGKFNTTKPQLDDFLAGGDI